MMRIRVLLLVPLLTALAASGCYSFRLEASFKLPAELTATAQPRPAAATATPKPVETQPTRTLAAGDLATPTATVWEPLAAIERFLAEQHRAGARPETMVEGLEKGLAGPNVGVRALTVPATVGDELPMILVAYGQAGGLTAQGHAILWWQRDELRCQPWPVAADPSVRESFGPDTTFLAAHQQVRNGRHELGVVYDANSGGSAQAQVYRLLVLEAGQWRTLWDGRLDSDGRWKFSHAMVSLPGVASGGDALATVELRSSSWQLMDGREGFFHESNPGPHRYFVDTWQRQGDRYVLASSRTEPSAYATVVEFVYRLARGEEQEVAALVLDPQVIERARAVGLDRKPERPWLINLDSPETETHGPIEIVEGPAVKILCEERGGQWLIKAIVDR